MLLLSSFYTHLSFLKSNIALSTIRELGYGEFGMVSLATWTEGDVTHEVAIKTLNSQASETDKIRFFQEATIMGQFLHENVIRLYGMIRDDPAMIVLEYAMKGDLRQYLIKLQPE